MSFRAQIFLARGWGSHVVLSDLHGECAVHESIIVSDDRVSVH